ncbi:MAG: ATP-dependent protease [Armatimonadetes bacterium]|nr:ATP-dependent protease [Armatimonadota bacterium]
MDRLEVPLFPLNTVLFPRMPLPLHVFEERFRKLIGRCSDAKEPFGVVLATDADERGRTAARIGTLARIHALQHLDDGRMNVLAVGDERFAVLRLRETPDDFQVATIETLRDAPASAKNIEPLVNEVRRLFGVYFDALVSKAGIEVPEYELPGDPSDLSFVVASVVQLPVSRRQSFLELTNTSERLQQEVSFLQRSIARLDTSRSAGQIATPFDSERWKDVFSRN